MGLRRLLKSKVEILMFFPRLTEATRYPAICEVERIARCITSPAVVESKDEGRCQDPTDDQFGAHSLTGGNEKWQISISTCINSRLSNQSLTSLFVFQNSPNTRKIMSNCLISHQIFQRVTYVRFLKNR